MVSSNSTRGRPRHPGRGTGAARIRPKGRRVDPGLRAEVRSIIGDGPRRRDLLVEYLHALQDRLGHLPVGHLAALAAELDLAQAEVYEVATFYAHFQVVAEDAPAPPPLTVRVCDGLACEMRGGRALLDELAPVVEDRARVVRAPCMGRCFAAPVASVGQHFVDRASVATVAESVARGQIDPVIPPYEDLAGYRAGGGYGYLGRCLRGELSPEAVIAQLEDSGLRGLGGAGFGPGRKWQIVRAQPGPRLMVVNADEGEPGTFKDRFYLESSPHQVLEGALIAAWAVAAETVYVYLRDEYPGIHRLLSQEIPKLEAAGLAGHARLELRRGAGAYICGEESAMIESIEGKRGLPRHRPPYVAQVGLFGRPTLVNNVETLYWIRDILERGAEWFARFGRHGGKGLRSYSVSGRVRSPGVKLAPAGITARELLEEHAGGMAAGHAFHAYLPGGASGGILPSAKADLPLDFGELEPHGCFVGSHAVLYLSDRDDLRAVALNLLRFFADESCGQCTPCRVGTAKTVRLMEQDRWDRERMEQLAAVMADASICGLGQAAANPLLSLLRDFPEVLE
jgi:NADH:ubiquinone oxidoreductase subunit F (NADH-binding)/NADH:ubiquinone oxidoreductase subunit E